MKRFSITASFLSYRTTEFLAVGDDEEDAKNNLKKSIEEKFDAEDITFNKVERIT